MQRDTIVRNLLEENKLSEAYLICLENIISMENPGLSRDVMCYRILDALFEKSHNIFMSLWKEEQHFIKDKELISMFQKKNERFQKQKNYKISVFDFKSEKEQEILGDFWDILKEKYKGKVLYIDIWTTWCGPCRSEIPYAIELHEYYKNKPLAFVNICMSSNKDVWEETIKKNHIAGDNYYLNKSQARLFRDKIHFQGYPTYLIIDKNGILTDESAPRPSSDKKIKAKLDKLLEE
jgi:thiol-disulfide isomerase/thioredoxin